MKICSICGIGKSEQDFFYRNKRAEKLHAQCKQCYIDKRRAIWKGYYHRHGSKYRENAVQRNRALKAKLRSKMLEYLSDKSCLHCGVADIRVLDFDHIDPIYKIFQHSRRYCQCFQLAKNIGRDTEMPDIVRKLPQDKNRRGTKLVQTHSHVLGRRKSGNSA